MIRALYVPTGRHVRHCAFVIACATSSVAAQPASPNTAVVIAYVMPDTTEPAQRAYERGVRLGLAEAERAAELLHRELRLIVITPGDSAREMSDRLGSAGARAVLAPSLNDRVVSGLAGWSTRPGVAILTMSDWRALSDCAMMVFRTGPDRSFRNAALRRILGADARLTPTAIRDSSWHTLELWHPDLERFGARQLSDRFRARYGTAMTSEAWEGWMAVKVVWESALRAPDGDLAAVIARTGFDGHKGAALRFGMYDHVLVQPLVIVRHAAAGPIDAGVVVKELAWPADLTSPADSTRPNLRCRR